MRILRPAVVAASLLLLPMISAAGVISFEISDGGELAVDFGQVPVQFTADADGDTGYGSFELLSGPLTGFSTGDGFSSYSYGPGVLTMQLTIFNPNGPDVFGTFTATVLGFSIDVTELRECDEDEEADDCEDPDFPGSTSNFFITLGPGVFDPQMAKVLGIRKETLGGDMMLDLETILDGPGARERRGYERRGYTDLDIVTEEVPEPGLLVLGLSAAAGVLARRRRA